MKTTEDTESTEWVHDTLTVERNTAIHQAQILTYMKLAEIPEGLLINFNVPLLKQGLRRFSL